MRMPKSVGRLPIYNVLGRLENHSPCTAHRITHHAFSFDWIEWRQKHRETASPQFPRFASRNATHRGVCSQLPLVFWQDVHLFLSEYVSVNLFGEYTTPLLSLNIHRR